MLQVTEWSLHITVMEIYLSIVSGLKPEIMLKYISVTVIFLRYFKPWLYCWQNYILLLGDCRNVFLSIFIFTWNAQLHSRFGKKKIAFEPAVDTKTLMLEKFLKKISGYVLYILKYQKRFQSLNANFFFNLSIHIFGKYSILGIKDWQLWCQER